MSVLWKLRDLTVDEIFSRFSPPDLKFGPTPPILVMNHTQGVDFDMCMKFQGSIFKIDNFDIFWNIFKFWQKAVPSFFKKMVFKRTDLYWLSVCYPNFENYNKTKIIFLWTEKMAKNEYLTPVTLNFDLRSWKVDKVAPS